MFGAETRVEYYFKNSTTGKKRWELQPTSRPGDSIVSIEVDELIAGRIDFPNRHTIEFDDRDQTATIRKGGGEARIIEGDIYLQVQAIQRAFDEMDQLGMLPSDEIEEMRAAKLRDELDKVLPRRNGLQKVAAGIRRFNIYMEITSPKRHVTSGSIRHRRSENNI